MRERKYSRYRKEKRIAFAILAVLAAAVLAFILVFSLTAEKNGNPLSSLTPEINGSLDMNTGSSISGGSASSDVNFALGSNEVTEVGTVPSGYTNTTGTLFTADYYKNNFATFRRSTNLETEISGNYYMTADQTINWHYFGSKNVFTGTFDGCGHTITINESAMENASWNNKFSYAGTESVNGTVKPSKAGSIDYFNGNFLSYGLFGKTIGTDTKSATVKNLKIVLEHPSNDGIEFNNASNSAFGILTGWLRNGTVENVSIEIKSGSKLYIRNERDLKENVVGLFAGIAGSDNDGQCAKFYNVQSIINGTFEFQTAKNTNKHVGLGGIVGSVANMDMNGAVFSGSGSITISTESNSSGWRMMSGFAAMARFCNPDIKAPTAARYKMQNLISSYTGNWSMSASSDENYGGLIVGDSNSVAPSTANGNIKLYTPYDYGSASDFSGKNAMITGNTRNVVSGFSNRSSAQMYLYARAGTASGFVTHVNVRGDADLKLLHALGSTSSTVIAVPTSGGSYAGVENVAGATFNSGGQYANLSAASAGQYVIEWVRGVAIPEYSLDWLTDFGKVPYGYNGIPDGATAIGSQSDLNSWLGSSSNYGYLTADFTLEENWWSNTAYKTLGANKVLDGAGHTVTISPHTSWSMRNGSAEYTVYGKQTVLTGCLFHYNEGTIKNLIVKAAATSKENNANSNRAMLGGLVVGLNKPTGRIENVNVYVGSTWEYECDATTAARYNVFGGVVGSNEGYVGYSGATVTGTISSSAGKGGSNSSNISILGGVIGINFGTAEYLTSYGGGTLQIVAINGNKYLGSIVGAACSASDNSVFNSSAMPTPPSRESGTFNYVFSGFTGTLITTNANAYVGSAAGYVSSAGSSKGVYWAVASGLTGTYSMAANGTAAANRSAGEGSGIGGGAAAGGNIRATDAVAGAIHGYYDYFYNDGSLGIEFENPADISSISCTNSNVKILAALKEAEIPKTVLDGNNNVSLTVNPYNDVAYTASDVSYTTNNPYAGLRNNKTSFKAIALAGRTDASSGTAQDYSPEFDGYVGSATSTSTLSLPLSGTDSYKLTSDVSVNATGSSGYMEGTEDGYAYKGTLDGQGHTLTINLNSVNITNRVFRNTSYDKAHGGYFGAAGVLATVLKGATIQNIHIVFTGSMTFKVNQTDNKEHYNYGYYGMLAGFALNTTIKNCIIEFPTGVSAYINKNGGDSAYFGGLFGMTGGSTLVKNSVIKFSGGEFEQQTTNATTIMGLFVGRVATTDTAAGYENLIIEGNHSVTNTNGYERVATVFGISPGWLSDFGDNIYYYKRKNIYFYNSTITLSGDRKSLFAETNSTGDGKGNSTTYIDITNINSSITTTQCQIWTGGIGGKTDGLKNTNGLSSATTSPIGSLSVADWRGGVEQAILNSVSATVSVDGKSFSNSSNSAALDLYFVQSKKLYGSMGNYTVRGFLRYGTQSDANSRYYSSVSAASVSSSVSGTSVNLGPYTLKAQLSAVGYAEQDYGQALNAAQRYETVYAKFNKIQTAYNGASGAYKEFYKSMLERSAGPGGLGILSVAPPSCSLVYSAGDGSLGTELHWISGRVSVTAVTTDAIYVFRGGNGSGSYRLDITPSFVSLKGLVTEYVQGTTDSLAETEDRRISNGGADSAANGSATLYGVLSDGSGVYFGQTANAKTVNIRFNTSMALYSDLAAAKTAVSSDGGPINGYFTVSGVGEKILHESSGKYFVSLPDCGYSIIVDEGPVVYSADGGGTVSVGSSARSTVALYRLSVGYGTLQYSGDVADCSEASGWKHFANVTAVTGSYVPERGSSVLQNVRLSYNGWSTSSVSLPGSAAMPAPGSVKEYKFSDFGVNGAANFGSYFRFDGADRDVKKLSVAVNKINIGVSDVTVTQNFSGSVTGKIYDAYPVSRLADVMLCTGVTVSLSDSLVHANFKTALVREVLGQNYANCTVSHYLADGAGNNYQTDGVLGAGSYKYSADFRLTVANAGYNVAAALSEGSGLTVRRDDLPFTVKPLPLSFSYTMNGQNFSEIYTGRRIDFVSATASLSADAEALIRGQYADNSDKDAAAAAVKSEIAAVPENQIGIRYLYAADADDANTMFDADERRGVTYASETRVVGGRTVVSASGPINAGTYCFSGYVVGNPNFIGLTGDYKELAEVSGRTLDAAYFRTMAARLQAFYNSAATRGWAVNLDSNNGYADAFNYAAYGGAGSLADAFVNYFNLLAEYGAYPGLFEQLGRNVRTVAVTRSAVSVYVKDSAIEYGSVDAFSLNSETLTKGPIVENADYVITDTSASPSVTVRIKPEAFSFDGTTYDYLPVKLADPNNPESSLTAYRSVLYIDGSVGTGNPNVIVSSVDGNLTVVRKELTVSWAYDTSDASYQATSGVYHYESGVKHTMIPTYHGILNNNALDLDIVGDGDMETVGVHKITAAFSVRHPLESYNYYLGTSATGYMTVAPATVGVDIKYFSNENRNSWDESTYQTHNAGQTLYAAITFTVGGGTYYAKSDGGYWRAASSDADRLDLTVYPAFEWLAAVKSNLTYSAADKISIDGWAGSQCTVRLNAADAGSSYTFTLEMNGFNAGNFNLDMHSARSVYIYNSPSPKNSYDIEDSSDDYFKHKSTSATISMTAAPGQVLSKDGKYYDGGNISTLAAGDAVHDFTGEEYQKLGYIFNAGDYGVRSKGLAYVENGTLVNQSNRTSRYSGFDGMVYSVEQYRRTGTEYSWDYVANKVYIFMLYFNVNIDNPVTAAIAKNGGINVSVGGVAVTAGQEEIHSGWSYYTEYQASPLTAGIALNDRGVNSNCTLSELSNSELGTYLGNTTKTTLGSKIYSGSAGTSYRENVLYGGNINEIYMFNTNDYIDYQSVIYASNATEPTGSTDDAKRCILYNDNGTTNNRLTSFSSAPVDLRRKTMVSSASTDGTSVLKGDSFRVNLYSLARQPFDRMGYTEERGIMAQFGKLQIALSKSDTVAPEVSMPFRYGNGYRFTVTDAVGVDTSSVAVRLADNRTMSIANGGLKVVSKTLSNGLVVSATFETAADAYGVPVGADRGVINEIVSVSASDITYAGGCNTATYGFNSDGNWVVSADGVTFSAVDTDFSDFTAPEISITHVGSENCDVAGSGASWMEFAADDGAEQARAQKYITSVWRQQNYLWLKYSAGTGKIPPSVTGGEVQIAALTSAEYSGINNTADGKAAMLNIAEKYAQYVGTAVLGNGVTVGYIRVMNGSGYRHVFFDTATGANGYYTRTSTTIYETLTFNNETLGGTVSAFAFSAQRYSVTLTTGGATKPFVFSGIPVAEITDAEYNGIGTTVAGRRTVLNIAAKYAQYVGIAVLGSGAEIGYIRVRNGSNYRHLVFVTATGQNWYYTKTAITFTDTITGTANPDNADNFTFAVRYGYVTLKETDGSIKAFAFRGEGGLSRVAVYDSGDFTGAPVFEEYIPASERYSVYSGSAIRLEANTRYYFIAEDVYGNRTVRTLHFGMVDTADASALSIIADPVELDNNNLKPYAGSAVVGGGAFSNWSPVFAEQLFANPSNPRFCLDLESDGIFNYSVMLVGFDDGKILVALRTFDDGKISYICGTREFTDSSLSHTFNAAADAGTIPQWLLDSGFSRMTIDDARTVTLYDTAGHAVASSAPMVIDTDDYNSYIEDTWSNSSVVMRLVGRGESNSLARFYYRYAPDPANPNLPNTAINENVTSNGHLFRNYGWTALPVDVDGSGNVVVADSVRSLIFEHTGIYRFEIKIELGAGQNAYLVYRDSFGNWVCNAYAEGGSVRAYKVDQTHYTTYNAGKPGYNEFGKETEIGYYTVKIDKRVYFLDLKNYWYAEESEYDAETGTDGRVEDFDPNIGDARVKNTEFAAIDVLKWNKDDQDYTTPLKKQEDGEYAGAYNVGMASVSNKNTWVRLDIRSHIKDIGGDSMWYAIYKILADVYVGDELISAGVDLPIGSEMNRFEVGKENDAEDGTDNSIAVRRLREMAINMPDPSIGSLDNVRLVYRIYYKYYYSFVIDYAASYANYYGSEPQYGLNGINEDGSFTVSDDRITPISGSLRRGCSFGEVRMKPVELHASDGSVVNFNYSSFAILSADADGNYNISGYTVTYTDARGIATTENIFGDNVKPISAATPAGKHFYAVSGLSITDGNAGGGSAADYILIFQKTALRTEEDGPVAASMTGTQIQFVSDKKPYSFYGFALAESDSTQPGSEYVYRPEFSDACKVNSVTVNGTEYFIKIVNDADTRTFAELYLSAEFVRNADSGYWVYGGAPVGSMAVDSYGLFTVNGETFSLSQLMVYDGEGYEVGSLGSTFTIENVIYAKGNAVPYYTVEKAFVNVSKGGNFVKLYDGTNNYIGGSADAYGWNANEYAFYDDASGRWKPGKAVGTVPEPGLTAVEIAAYYVGSDGKPQANVSRKDDITYLKMFLASASNYRFATAETAHTVQNGCLVAGDAAGALGSAGLSANYKTVYADGGVHEIIGQDTPVFDGVSVPDTVNWSSIMLPDTSYANANGAKPNRTDGVPLSAESSISTVLARPVAAKSEVQNNDIINVTFNGAAQGGSAIRIIEDAAAVNDAAGYGTLPSETVVFSVSEDSSSPILAGTYNFPSVALSVDSIYVAGVETAFSSANADGSIANNYYVDSVTGGQNVSFKLIINTLENSFVLNRVVKSDGSGYELRVTVSNLKRSKDALDFLGIATSDGSGAYGKRYLTDGEFSAIKTMIAEGGKFEDEDALGVGQNLADAERYYALIESGTQLRTDVDDKSELSDNEKELLGLYSKLSQILEYRFQCALGKAFKSANNGSDNFYANMPDFREGRFSDLKFDVNTGTFTMVFKGNVNLDTVFFSDRYRMRVSGLADLVSDNGRPNGTAAYSTNSWTSDSSLSDGQIERYDYTEAAENSAAVTYISNQQELKDWLSMTDSSEAGYATGVLTDNVFEFTWGFANGLGGAPIGLAQGRTLNGNGYAIGISGAEFNNAGKLNFRLTTKNNPANYATIASSGITTKRWSAGGVFLQYVDGTIENTEFVYMSTRKYDVGDINVQGNNTAADAYGLSVGIISGFAGNTASFRNVSLDVKGQFYVDYFGTQLLIAAYIGVGGFAGYADNIASFNDCTVNYYSVPGKTLDNGYTSDRYAVSATISSASNYGMHLGWGGFAGITGGGGTAHRLAVTTQIDAEYAENVSNVYAIYIGRNTGYVAWTQAAGAFGFTKRTKPAGSGSQVSGNVDGIINKFSGRIAGSLAAGGEYYFGSLAGEVGRAASFTNIYTYGTSAANCKIVGSSRSALPLIGTSTDMSASIVHDSSLGIYADDEGLVDYYFGGNRYDCYEEDGVKYFYQTTKFINGSQVAYSPFDDYTDAGGTEYSGWTGWKLAANADGSYKIFRDYYRNAEIGSIRFSDDGMTSGSFALKTAAEGTVTYANYTFDADGVKNESGETVAGMTVDARMMTVSDQNNTYYFSVPLSGDRTVDADTPRRDGANGVNIEILAPAQSYVWEYHSTFYANNLGKTSAVSRIVWNLDQAGGRFDTNYAQNADGFVIPGKNEDAAYVSISGVNWHTPALGQFRTMSADSHGTIFQFVYDGQNHNNNISVEVTVNGSKQIISADASIDMIDAGVYVVGTFDLGADMTYEGSSGYVFDTAERRGQARNVTSPQLMVVIYPRVLRLEGGVAKQYDGTAVYEHAVKDELVIETDGDGNAVNETLVSDGTVDAAESASYTGILAADKNGSVSILGNYGSASAGEDKTIGFEDLSKRRVLKYTDDGKDVLLTVKRGQDRKPVLDADGNPELTFVLYGFGNGDGRLDADDDIPFNDVDSVVAFYAAIGQVDSVADVKKAFAEAKPDAAEAEIEAAVLAAYGKFDAGATEIATAEIYNFEARVGGQNSSGEAGTDEDEYFVGKTTSAVITKTEYGLLASDAERENYEFLSAYVYIAAALSGDRGFNYVLVADGAKVPLTGGKVGDAFTVADYNKDAIGNEYVKITPREVEVWFNGLFQSFYNDEADAGYDYKDALCGVTVITLKDGDGVVLTGGEADEVKAAAVRRAFADLPSVLTDEEVLGFYTELQDLEVEFVISDEQDAAIRAAFAEQNAEQGREVRRFTLEADVGGDNFAVNNGGGSQVKNRKNPVLTVGHYNGKVGVDGLPYVGDKTGLTPEETEELKDQYMSLTVRRDVLNLNYRGVENGKPFDYSGFSFYLENDIDMNNAATRGIDWSTSAPATFDGGNHAIKNFIVAQNASGGEADGIVIGFFNIISEGSAVKNLILEDVEVIIYGQSRFEGRPTITRVGGIAGANAGIIENVVFEGTIKFFRGDGNATGGEITKGILGGIAGSNGGVIRKAFSLANIETTAASADVLVGGLAGVNVGVIGADCYVAGKAGMVHGSGCTVGSVVGQNFFAAYGNVYNGEFVDADGSPADESIVLDMSTDGGAYGAATGDTTTAALGYAGRTVEYIVRNHILKDGLYGRPTDESNTAPYGTEANPVKVGNFRQLEMALEQPYFFYEITEDVVFNTGFDEEKLDEVIIGGYGYGRIKIAEGTKIILRYNHGVEVSIVATASGIEVRNFANGTVATPYGKTFAEMVASFFKVG